MKAFEDAMDLLMAVERVFNDKPIRDFDKNKVTNYLQMQKVMLKMTEYQETKGQNMEDKDLEVIFEFKFLLTKKLLKSISQEIISRNFSF